MPERMTFLLRSVLASILIVSASESLPAAPGKDSFTYRNRLYGAAGRAESRNVGATKEPGEPDHAGNPGGASVWWKWRAPVSGTALFETAGSGINTLLAVYAGSSISSLDLVAGDDDGGAAGTSCVTFDAVSGLTYAIVVDGSGGEEGSIVLEWSLTDSEGEFVAARGWPDDQAALDGQGTGAVIYGSDSRLDIYQVTDPAILAAYDSTVALVYRSSDLEDNGNGTYSISGPTYGIYDGLCQDVAFWSQPSIAYCSGFLVAPDLVATAGHCIVDASECSDTAFIFGYEMLGPSTPRLTFPASQVYFCQGIVDRFWDEDDFEAPDWAILRLDRPVPDHEPLQIRRSGKITDNQKVIAIGHPKGLPAKVAGDASVIDNAPVNYFDTNLDIYGGNSGSAVFDAVTLKVEGVLSSGYSWDYDYDELHDCWGLHRCSQAGAECLLGSEMRTTLFSHLVPEIKVCDPPTNLTACQDQFGSGEADNGVLLAWKNGEESYAEIGLELDGLPLRVLDGAITECHLEGLPLGAHTVVLAADCGGTLGPAKEASLSFNLVPSRPDVSPPHDLSCRFTTQDWSRVTMTWRNSATEAGYIEIYIIDKDGVSRLVSTVGGRATSANVEGTVKTDRLAIRAFYQLAEGCLFSDFIACTPTLPPGLPYRAADCDATNFVDISDAIFTLGYLFRGKDAPPCEVACDSNKDEVIDLTDAIYTLLHLFMGGPPPPGNTPKCDQTAPDQLLGCPIGFCSD